MTPRDLPRVNVAALQSSRTVIVIRRYIMYRCYAIVYYVDFDFRAIRFVTVSCSTNANPSAFDDC